MHATKPCEWNDPSSRTHANFFQPPMPADEQYRLPDRPGLGIDFDETALAARRIDVAAHG